MKKHLTLSFVSGLFAIVCYLACALLAYAHYPLPYSPLKNWLSDLGNPDLNPSGALSGVFHTVTVLEWVTVALLLCSLGFLSTETNQRSSAARGRTPMMASR